MKLDKRLQDLFDELEKDAYNQTTHNYYYKEANQTIRKHVEAIIENKNHIVNINKKRIKIIVREWFEFKTGIILSNKTLNKLVCDIITKQHKIKK